MRYVLTGILLFITVTVYSQAKRAESLIEKVKYQDAYELLHKAILRDSLAAAEKYILAGLFFNKDLEYFNLDSAYWYILESIESFEVTEEKEKQKIIKDGYFLERLDTLKKEIEVAGFERARKNNNEQAYIAFINDFSTSLLIDSAVWYRNKVAFEVAERENVYQSYKQFFDKYPEAEQVKEAKTRYEKLLYLNKTSDGKLNSFHQFLIEYPETWHRKEAEQVIYNIITGKHTEGAYLQFINLYPDSWLNRQAKLAYYSILNDSAQLVLINNDFLGTQDSDSIKKLNSLANQLLLPSIHEGRYVILNERGEAVLQNLEGLAEISKCIDDETRLLLVKESEEYMLIALDSTILTKGTLISFQDRGDLIKVVAQDGQYFIHSNGTRTNPNSYEQAEFCGPYVMYKEGKKWGLETITGISMTNPRFDSLFNFGDIILTKKGKKWAFVTSQDLYPLIDGEQISFNYEYDSIDLIGKQYLVMEKGDMSALYDAQGQVVIPFANQVIELVDGSLFIDRDDSLKDTRYANKWYKDININEDWLVGIKDANCDIYYKNTFLMNVSKAQIIGNSAVLITIEDSTYCYFNDSTRITIKENDRITQVNSIGITSTPKHYVFTNEDEGTQVYDNRGEIVDVVGFKKLVDLGDKYMLWQKDKSFNMLDSTGNILLRGVDAATCLENGYISFLFENKFGLYNIDDSTKIDARYDKPLYAYSDSLFVFTLEERYGIINRLDSVLVPDNYEEINYLNDTLVFLKKDFRWNIWDLGKKQRILDGISNYWKIKKGETVFYKIFKGIGYGIWNPENGIILDTSFGEITIVSKGDNIVFIAEKWVEEADLVVLLYYNINGELLQKEILSTTQYESLVCNVENE